VVGVREDLPGGGFVPSDDHLGDAHAAGDGDGLFSQVDQEDLNFAAVVGVDGSWGVGDGESMFEGQAATGADLGFKTDGESDDKPAGASDAIQGLEDQGFALGEGGEEIHTGGVRRLVRGLGKAFAVRQPGYRDIYRL
jgi:hypothetical protein